MAAQVSFEGLTPKQELFVAAVVSGNQIQFSAKCAKVSEKTAHAWLKRDDIKAAIKQAQKELFEATIDGLMLHMEEAVTTLYTIMKDVETPPATRVRCVQIVIENALQLHKFAELEERLIVLEEKGREARAHPTD